MRGMLAKYAAAHQSNAFRGYVDRFSASRDRFV